MKIKPFKVIFWMLILIPLALWVAWLLRPNKELRIFILDKTVLTNQVQEHLSLFWVLNNGKYVHSGKKYHPTRDYAGFFPNGSGKFVIKSLDDLTVDSLNRLAATYDAAVYTDLYGIYTNEWKEEYGGSGMDSKFMSQRSPLIYGGMKQNDLDFLLRMKEKKKLIIAEFNTMASPTSEQIRQQFEQAFGIRWTGWVGRYFDVLDTLKNRELPDWLIHNYLRQNHGVWPFHRSGIAFVNQQDHVVVLENNVHLKVEVPQIISDLPVVRQYHVKPMVNYPFWFDIISVNGSNHVLSFYHLSVNQRGDSVLKANGIPSVFPAMVHSKKPAPFYYLAGDFSDNPLSLSSSYFDHVNWFPWVFYSSSLIERKNFFWQYYQPFMQRTISAYYESLKQ